MARLLRRPMTMLVMASAGPQRRSMSLTALRSRVRLPVSNSPERAMMMTDLVVARLPTASRLRSGV